jgi:predicted Zn-dependent peptidase
LEFREACLGNGLQIIGERCPSVFSAAMGFFVRTGARDETDEISGVSHFLEHMVFKGTDRHSADDVNRVFDEVGAKYNASTSEELTLFYAAILPEYLPRTFDLLADIIRPALRTEDFNMEKKVILEEIGMYDDQPTYTAYETLMQTHFAGHPLGHSVLGTNESITALSAAQMREYHASRYKAGNIILAVAGNFDWPEFLALAEKHCSAWPAGIAPRATPEAKPAGGRAETREPAGTRDADGPRAAGETSFPIRRRTAGRHRRRRHRQPPVLGTRRSGACRNGRTRLQRVRRLRRVDVLLLVHTRQGRTESRQTGGDFRRRQS